jgi:uncharacterized protein YycO
MVNKKQTIKGEIIEIKEILNELKIDFKYVRSLVEKHDTALYGKDGTNGICRYIEKFKNHMESHWKILTAIIGVCGVVFGLVNILLRYIK